jgi:hypothetical protein
MQLRRIGLSVENLRAIPPKERALFVLLGHVANEVNTIDKITYLSTLALEGPRWQAQATAAQTLILARVLVGKLYEAWEAIQSGYFRSRLSRVYVDLIDNETTSSLDRLKKYFGRKNLLNRVRNEVAFHYSLEHAAIPVPDDALPEELAMYLHESAGSQFIQVSDYLMTIALAESLAPGAPENALEVLLAELRDVCIDLNEFVLGFMHAVLVHRIGADSLARSGSVQNVANAPSATRKRLPYFIQLP